MIATGFTYALTLAMLAVIYIDATRYLIPNKLNLAVLALYIGALFFFPANVPMALAAAAIVLVLGLGLFALGLMGGGDIKLLAVLALWTGWGMPTVNFIIATAIVGGVLVMVMLLARFVAPDVWKGTLPRFLTKKEPVPYGLAIAGAFLLLLWQGMVPMLAAAP